MTADQAKATKTPKSENVRKSSKHVEDNAHVFQAQGLCETCDLAENCMNRKNSTCTVHYCEEFTESLNAPVHKLRQVPSQLPSKSEVGIQQSGLKGLCVNCDHRESCENAKTIGGVWHCEEYR